MEARQPFSRLGWALFAQMAVMLAAQWGVLLLATASEAVPVILICANAVNENKESIKHIINSLILLHLMTY